MSMAWGRWVLLMACATVCSCAGGDDSPGADGRDLCEDNATRLRECGLLTEGSVHCDHPRLSEMTCAAQCLQQASCADLTTYTCVGEDSLPSGNALFECFDACKTFVCNNGERIYPASVCDGFTLCSDGSDEANCTNLFTCDDGSTTVDFNRCNGIAGDCPDGSDEADCTNVFTCDDGEVIGSKKRCNGARNCSDGSDEANCPPTAQAICS